MEDEVKIKDSEEAQNSFVEKIKSNKNLMIICGVVVIILIIILISRGKKNSINEGRQPNHYDYLIVGSGLYGTTFNYLSKKAEKTTFVVEKSDVISGYWYCENIEGNFVHKYGPHVLHTDNKKLWDFVNNLIHFNPYIQQSVTKVKDKLYSLPFNMWAFNQLWGVTTTEEEKAKIEADKYTGEVHNIEE